MGYLLSQNFQFLSTTDVLIAVIVLIISSFGVLCVISTQFVPLFGTLVMIETTYPYAPLLCKGILRCFWFSIGGIVHTIKLRVVDICRCHLHSKEISFRQHILSRLQKPNERRLLYLFQNILGPRSYKNELVIYYISLQF